MNNVKYFCDDCGKELKMDVKKSIDFLERDIFIDYDEDSGDINTVCDSCGCHEFTLGMNDELACIQCEETIGFAERIREDNILLESLNNYSQKY
tara:strand:+ start:182 stop:463 length:282 start_codon:yes stop_codon:yes gene_type:complete